MTEAMLKTISYFRPLAGYFWQWAERGSVIEWKDGDTICYTDDLIMLMKALTNSHLPSLGAVLLVLTACNGNWRSGSYEAALQGLKLLLQHQNFEPDKETLDYYINQAGKCADMISALPKELRSGANRAHLLHEVFAGCKPAIQEEDIRSAADELAGGRINPFILHPGKPVTTEQYKEDLACLVAVFHKYTYTDKLAQRLRTGVFRVPDAAPLFLPEPETKPGNFWEELAAGRRTAGIADLARHIIAALHIPMHTKGSSDQPYGGVSDITNRGSYDRLLLSELAYDDATLLARLANNESLYLQREQPPHNPKNKRIILADATIKMWGIPRVFATSAAIACAMNVKHGEKTEAFMLKGSEAAEADLSTSKGVLQALEIMDHSLNCYAALETFCSSLSFSKQTDVILITREEVLHDARFQKVLASYPDALSFLLGIDRSGSLHFYSVTKGRSKLLSTARFDMDNILFPAEPKPPVKKNVVDESSLPRFFTHHPSPLLFPVAGLRLTTGNSFYHNRAGTFAITDSCRLLHWATREKAATELLPKVEGGYYSFGCDKYNRFHLLITSISSLQTILYTVNLNNRMTERKELDVNGISYAIYQDECFFVKVKTGSDTNPGIAVIDCNKGMLSGTKPYSLVQHLFTKEERDNDKINRTAVSNRYVNNGYNILQRFHSVAVDREGCLLLNNKQLSPPALQNNHLNFRIASAGYKIEAVKENEIRVLPSSEHARLTYFTWPEGSQAIIDGRGFLHLISSDRTLAEVSLVLIQGKTTAGWASDGRVSGNPYFIPAASVKHTVYPTVFYKEYIEPILQRINRS